MRNILAKKKRKWELIINFYLTFLTIGCPAWTRSPEMDGEVGPTFSSLMGWEWHRMTWKREIGYLKVFGKLNMENSLPAMPVWSNASFRNSCVFFFVFWCCLNYPRPWRWHAVKPTLWISFELQVNCVAITFLWQNSLSFGVSVWIPYDRCRYSFYLQDQVEALSTRWWVLMSRYFCFTIELSRIKGAYKRSTAVLRVCCDD